MAIEDICSPAIIYVAFSFVHILIDIFKNLYNDALVKFVIMLVFTTVLNILCERGLGVVSWLIVFIPFITMTLLSQLVLMVLSEKSNNVGRKTKIDEINNLRSNVPMPAIEFSHCKTKECTPGDSSDGYMIDTKTNKVSVTDATKLRFDTNQYQEVNNPRENTTDCLTDDAPNDPIDCSTNDSTNDSPNDSPNDPTDVTNHDPTDDTNHDTIEDATAWFNSVVQQYDKL